MKVQKKVIGNLEKCYSLATFDYDGEKHLAVAAEKKDEIDIFTYDGQKKETLYGGDGGVMTMQQYPGKPILLATQKFYSPNNSAEAKIIYFVFADGKWEHRVLCEAPFVHRFGILERDGVKYLIVCTLKSAHAFKNDWTCPGRVWVAKLPEDITQYDENHLLELEPLISGLFKNHGFMRGRENGCDFAVVGTDNGIYKVLPPEKGGEWSCEKLLDMQASDMLYLDFDGDGERELLVLTPFHGDTLNLWKKTGDTYENVYEYPEKLPFIHAIWGQEIDGRVYGFAGCREGARELVAVTWNKEKGVYESFELDRGAGAANVMFFKDGGENKLLAANRETDEIAVYTLQV